MKLGKVSEKLLKEVIFKHTGFRRNEVVLHAEYGEDCAAIDLGQNLAVVTTDPITCADAKSGYLAVHVACNDLAACGAKPVAILTTILLPPELEEKDFVELMEQIDKACKKLQIEVVGGHTEVTDVVRKPLICTTAIGSVEKGRLVKSSNAKPGDWIVVTKHVALEGTAILAYDFEEILSKKFSKDFIENCKKLLEQISVVEEGLIASQLNVSAMHDITEGGLIGALCEVAKASKVGFEVYQEKIPVLYETKAVCEFLDINPLKLISSGSMLICTFEPDKLVETLEKHSIKATVIGKIIEKGFYLVDGVHKRIICEDLTDEIYKVRERFQR
ncbi:AIR synthase family protein [Pseudothermotoga thermarum]|uniref:AIR synthase related protein domain protein n=1 Tax=Pseudothermotoga thermarum DSM 5069 TaxID=688269 RepID=F7YUT0_9THEM|nr:AIR synthase family protein [Pseudothermotoga thermarum]AEH50269.1 AIR synthase related protein domain protein [Pseudothermotoga thermarum DSM 5069]